MVSFVATAFMAVLTSIDPRKLEIEDIDQKKTFQHVSDVVISARGALNEKAWPEIDGLDSFKGKLLHSASWDQT